MKGHDLRTVLIRRRLVSPELIAEAVASSRGTDMSWLEQLLLLGHLDEEELVRCVTSASRVPRCETHRFAGLPRHALDCLPADVAIEHRAVPIAIEPDGDLRVAMVDPIDVMALCEIQFFACRPVVREAAAPTAVAWALNQYYGAQTALWPRGERRPQALVVGEPAGEPSAPLPFYQPAAFTQ